MTCVHINDGEYDVHICGFSPAYRLALADGRRVFMEWHSYLGPSLYHDRIRSREVEEWWQDQQIVDAVEWFQKRGERA